MEPNASEWGKTQPYACLPFIELAHESTIRIGPVIFWPSSRAEEFLPPMLIPKFQEYLKELSQIKTSCTGQGNQQGNQFVNTVTLTPKATTCISISKSIPSPMRENILIDSLYLLYFACTFRNLYYGQEIPTFKAFRKMIPASEDFFLEKGNWNELHIYETDREETVCIHIIDKDICDGLGKALDSIYLQSDVIQDPEFVQGCKRMIRSIRYLIDRFFQRFVNLFESGLNFADELFEPEDVIFLATSFETLFNIDKSHEMAADFKHKLRPLLHLKYTKPIEIFWKWVDDFYEVKRLVVSGESCSDPLFRTNPNFEVSHILLAIKLFVYSVYYYLYKYQLLESTHVDPYTPPDFKWIHPEEILLFFWTEGSVLEKVKLWIKDSEQGALDNEAFADLNLLTTLFVSLYDRYYLSDQQRGEGIVRFIPTPLAELTLDGKHILEKLKEIKSSESNEILIQNVHPYFVAVLEDRLQEKKIKKLE